LHIDYAKKGYWASNKNDYLAQMAKWLQHQEAIDLRSAYLRWCAELPPYDETGDDVLNNADDHDDQQTESADLDDQVTIEIPNVTMSYRVTKAPAFPNTPLHHLEQEYGASKCLPALKTFIQENFSPHTLQPNEYDHYSVYNAIHLMRPSKPHVSNHKHQQTIHATPEHSNGPQKPPSPARFDTVLLIEDDNHNLVTVDGGQNGVVYLHVLVTLLTVLYSGLRVAEIRVIFTLPLHLGTFPHPLAYVHWFTPIHVWDDAIGMYRMGRSTRNHKPRAAIVGIDHIMQGCHLLPCFGSGPVPRSWFQGRVLDLASEFYLNRYINFYLFKDLHPSHHN